MPSAAMPSTVGRMISRSTRACMLGRDHRRRRIGAHAAGVGPLVAVEQPLVVLAGGQRQHVLAVDHHDEAGLLAVEELFDHDARAGVAHAVADQHRVDRGVRLVDGGRHDHALAGGQAVGLDDDRRAASRRRRRARRPASVKVW